MSPKVLITPTSFLEEEGEHHRVLRDAGLEIIPNPYHRVLTDEEMTELIPPADALIVGVDPVSHRAIEAAPGLKVISKYGVGFDKIDLAAATRRRIPVTFTPGANQVSVAELAIGFIFALARSLPQMNQQIKGGQWVRPIGMEVAGKTLGILGLGRIGKEVARRAVGLAMKVMAYDLYKDEAFARKYNIAYRDLPEVLKSADFLSLHLNLTPQTRGLISGKELSLMKDTAFLINVARGELVDEGALYRTLKEGKIRGAALDVFSREPPWGLPFLELDNVILSGHVGARTKEAVKRQGLQASKNVLLVLAGQYSQVEIVNREVLEKEEKGAGTT